MATNGQTSRARRQGARCAELLGWASIIDRAPTASRCVREGNFADDANTAPRGASACGGQTLGGRDRARSASIPARHGARSAQPRIAWVRELLSALSHTTPRVISDRFEDRGPFINQDCDR